MRLWTRYGREALPVIVNQKSWEIALRDVGVDLESYGEKQGKEPSIDSSEKSNYFLLLIIVAGIPLKNIRKQ